MNKCFTAFDIKIIACVSMVLDHCGSYLFPGEEWMRWAGRLSFPLFCFLLTEGYRHTKNVKLYFIRLGIFALVSEIPFDLLGDDKLFAPERQNVFFTLFLGLLMLYLLDRTNSVILKAYIVIACMIFSQYFHFSYRYPGILMIFIFDYFRDFPFFMYLSNMADNFRLYYAGMQTAGSLALIPVSLYNGKRGPSLKYFFYAFYPCHLLIIYMIKKTIL